MQNNILNFIEDDIDIYSMSKSQLLELYNNAKAAYYAGNPIIDDFEFDIIEDLLGLSNKSNIGAIENDVEIYGSTKKYTIKHPFIMGSLSKIQFRKDKKSGSINWNECFDALNKYINAAKKGNVSYRIEPKYDGCSFEATYINGLLDKCSTRGDGSWGQDITDWLNGKLPSIVTNSEIANSSLVTVRGEVLIKVQTFEEKYLNEKANPRSFVSSCLNSDLTSERYEVQKDLDVICYDFRDVSKHKILNTYNFVSEFNVPEIDGVIDIFNIHNFILKYFMDVYDIMYNFRINKSKYQLDGYVWKPYDMQFEENDERPIDCVAFKFLPEIVQTEVINIEWTLGKNLEYTPVAILKPVQLMGTEVKRASLYNYEFVIKNLIMPGAIVNICKSGDIIPQIIEVVSIPDNLTFCESLINVPKDYYIEESYSQNGKVLVRHMMKKLDGKELAAHQFRASIKSLNIPSIGPANGEILVESECSNILELLFEKGENWIKEKFGYLKTGDIIVYELKNKIAKITLEEIIQSMNIPLCGQRVSEQCAIYLMGGTPNFVSMPEKAYKWIYSDSDEKKYLLSLMIKIGFDMPVYKTDNRIPIIMTGEPTAFGFKTKSEFLERHPEYRNTTSWKEVKILFTDDISSNTGKMQKAIKNNIPIKLYQ